MYRKSIAAFSCSLLVWASAAIAGEAPQRDWKLVLFGAQWCAPCRLEIRELAALAEAAKPARLQLAWIDRKPTNLPAPPPGGWSVSPPAEARRLMASAAPSARGLPMAILFDGTRACAVREGPITVLDLRGMKDSCRVQSLPVEGY